MLPLGPVVITRQQYDEALAQLPDPATYPDDSIEISVSAKSLMDYLGMVETVKGAEDWPMVVRFEKVTGDSPLFGVFSDGECWQLAKHYKIL